MKSIPKYDPDLAEAVELIHNAGTPEELFGCLRHKEKMPREVLDETYRGVKAMTDPQRFSGSKADFDYADGLQSRIDQLYQQAVAKFEAAAYGISLAELPARAATWMPFNGTRLKLKLGDEVARGSISTVYEGARASGDDQIGRLAIKVADDKGANEALWREKRVLEILHGADQTLRANLPPLLDHFRTDDDRVGLVFRFLENCHDLNAVRASSHHAQGVNRKHVAWIIRRMLAVSGYAHSQGIVHGNIEPAHVFLRPEDHHLFLIDWCWSSIRPGETGDRFRTSTASFSAPETRSPGTTPHPAADLYSIGKCVVFLLGGDTETSTVPDDVEPEYRAFIERLVDENPRRRASDAWEEFHRFTEIMDKLWDRKFIRFPI